MSKIYFKKLHNDAVIPTRGSVFSAGLDLSSVESVTIAPSERAIVATGLATIIPNDTYLRIAPRSGLAAKHGIDVLAGVVDSDYRGEIKVILINLGKDTFEINPGDRIAQAILEQCVLADVETVEDLTDSDRGAAGFGSTGI
jgi:dUTP pyrophosphatase